MSLFIGLMSGTSIDAIDAVLVEFTAQKAHIHASYRHAWLPELRDTLLILSQQTREQSTLHDLARLDVQIAELFAETILALLKHAQVSPQQICAIGSPGQTVYHCPDGSPPYTWQLGDPNVIAQRTGILTVADFRRRDIAAGGQGAPLTPACHNALLRSDTENRVVLNIGGIANITVLPRNCLRQAQTTVQPVLGFDTGPGNALLDAWCYQHRQIRMDTQGAWAASGRVNTDLLTMLLNDPYFARPAPKSTGRDYFNLSWLNRLVDKFAKTSFSTSSGSGSNLFPEPVEGNFSELVFPSTSSGNGLTAQDIQATLCELTITSIAQAISPHQPQRLLVCGGGVHNPLLMAGLARQLPNCIVESTATHGIDPDWVEAVSFAWLAKQRLDQQPSNLPSVTGARHAVVLGGIYL